jgi:hypothetical protein
MPYQSKAQLERSLELLREQIDDLTYRTAGRVHPNSTEEHNWLFELSPEYESWAQRIKTVIKSNFNHDSAPAVNLERATAWGPREYGEDRFTVIMSHYRKALEDALSAVRDDVHGELLAGRFAE